jgi:hypothetical protein
MLRQLLSRIGGGQARRDPYVAFLGDLEQPLEILPSTAMKTPLASFRLRTLIPSRRLAAAVRVRVLPLAQLASDPDLARFGEPVAAVLTKLPSSRIAEGGETMKALFDWMTQWRRAGRRLIADVSDNYASMGHPRLLEFQNALAREAELVVPCEALRSELQPGAAHPVSVIEDPYERETAAAVRTTVSEPLRLCWFGQFSGPTLKSVTEALLQLGAHLEGRPAILTVVAGARQLTDIRQFAAAMAGVNPSLELRFTQWSVEATWSAIEESDYVLLPQDGGDPWGRVKSHNRIVETLRCGRLPLATPIPSYLELSDYACVRPSLAEAFDWAVANADEARRRVDAGQEYIETRFSPQVIAEKWSRLLGIG